MEQVIAKHRAPAFIRSDHAPESLPVVHGRVPKETGYQNVLHLSW